MQLHPLTAVRDAGQRALAVGSTAFFLIAVGGGMLGFLDIRSALVLVPIAALLGAAYGVAYYLRFAYELTGETLSIQSGVFGRTDRSIPLGRVQNVDIRESFLQRAFGVAVVRVETAGGGETEAVLDFVAKEEAERLQRDIRARKGSTDAEGDPEPIDPLFAIDDLELALYSLTAFRPASLLVLVFAVPVGWETAAGVVLRVAAPLGGPSSLDPSALASVAGLVLALVGGLLAVLTTWAVSSLISLVGYHGFRLGRAGDDLVYERGLLRRYSGSIPLSKVQTLTLVEHVFARRLGYAGLRVETAGYAPGSGSGARDRPASAVPLADRERAIALARTIEPFDDLEFERPPTLARRRYAARYAFVVLGLTLLTFGVHRLVIPLEYWPLPLALLAAVPVAAHLKWANRGYHLGPDTVALRSGFWRRRTRIVPYERLQTVETNRTVFQRRLGLASVIADTASSATRFGADAVAYDLGTETARRLHGGLRARLQSTLGE